MEQMGCKTEEEKLRNEKIRVENEEVKEETKKFVHPDGGYGWVVVFAVVLINATVLTLIQCFGIIFNDFFEKIENKSLKISALLHLQSSLYCIVGFVASPFLKKHGYRKTSFVGATLMCSGIFLTSFATSYPILIFTISILTGIGQGVLMPATYLATNTYFKERLTVATSISTTGASILSIFMPKICDILLIKIGRGNTILVLSLISLLSLIGCYLMKPVKNDSKIEEKQLEGIEKDELLETNKVYNSTTIVKNKPSLRKRIIQIFDLNLLKNKHFLIAFVGLGLSFAAELNTVFLIQFILPKLSKFTQGDVAYVTSLQFGLDLIGRLIVPMLGHVFKAPSKLMYASALVLATFARTVLSVWFNIYWMVFLCCALIGLSKGTRAVFQSVIIPKLVPLENLPSAIGITMLFNGIVSIVIGSFIGLIRDKSNSDVPALHAASAISMTCVCLWLVERFFITNKEKCDKVDINLN